MIDSIQIGNTKIGAESSPFIIAELSGNHSGSKERALELIDAAAEAGADAIKLQTYTPETMTINETSGLFSIKNPKSLWNGYSLFELYEKAQTPWEWHKDCFEYASKKGLIAFSSAFDLSSVDFLESLNVPAYKISSFENNYPCLLKKVAATRKPVIMSTGASSLEEIDRSVKILRSNGCEKLILLKCTSNYPADCKESNLNAIASLSRIFGCPVGLSDHTIGIGVPIASVALGACVIEKHLTLSVGDDGIDSAFSLDSSGLKTLVDESKRAWKSLGNSTVKIADSEVDSRKYKRSVYVVENIKKGETLSRSNLRVIRPGDGLSPYDLENILGCTAKTDLKRGTPLSWEHIK